jgi:hypothetical protein
VADPNVGAVAGEALKVLVPEKATEKNSNTLISSKTKIENRYVKT